MDYHSTKKRHILAVGDTLPGAFEHIDQLGGKIMPVYSEEGITFSFIVILPEGSMIAPTPESQSCRKRVLFQLDRPDLKREPLTEYTIKLSDGVELTYIHHLNINNCFLTWERNSEVQQAIYDKTFRHPDWDNDEPGMNREEAMKVSSTGCIQAKSFTGKRTILLTIQAHLDECLNAQPPYTYTVQEEGKEEHLYQTTGDDIWKLDDAYVAGEVVRIAMDHDWNVA